MSMGYFSHFMINLIWFSCICLYLSAPYVVQQQVAVSKVFFGGFQRCLRFARNDKMFVWGPNYRFNPTFPQFEPLFTRVYRKSSALVWPLTNILFLRENRRRSWDHKITTCCWITCKNITFGFFSRMVWVGNDMWPNVRSAEVTNRPRFGWIMLHGL